MLNDYYYKLKCSKCNKNNIKAIKECYCFFCKECFNDLGQKILTHSYNENEICNICKQKCSVEMKFIFDEGNDNHFKFETFLTFFKENELEKKINEEKKDLMEDHFEKRKNLNFLYKKNNYFTEKIKFLEEIIIFLSQEKKVNLFELKTKFLMNPNFSIFENLNLLDKKEISLKENSNINSKENVKNNDFWKEKDIKQIIPRFDEFLEEKKLKKNKDNNLSNEILLKSSINSEDLLKLSKK